MDKRVKDLSGNQYGFWLVLRHHERRKNRTYFWCKCVCGQDRAITATALQYGLSKSCGCKRVELALQSNIKHGMSKTPTYKSWNSMHHRCQGKGGHEIYVERNITVCDRWHDFSAFLEDMGYRPKGTTLDRIDNEKGYSPENCRWATQQVQSNNKSTNVFFEFFGEKMTVSQAARKFNMPVQRLRGRLLKGIDPNIAVTLPKQKKGTKWLA